jgi:CheY-like chemotaxis protein
LSQALRRIGLHPGAPESKRIMIIDDDPKTLEILAAYLEEPGYQTLRALGGMEGIEMASVSRPDLILLDLIMPEISGFEVVDALRADARTHDIPIIIITAKQLTAEDRTTLNGHVLAILQKANFNHGHFLGEVKRALIRTAARYHAQDHTDR